MNSATRSDRLLGVLLVGYVVALNAPYMALVSWFGYDDVLREPPGEVLARLHAAGPQLVWAWCAFAFAALAFAPLAPRIERALGLRPGWTGPASAIAMFLGLARWTFVVPALAAAHAVASPTERPALEAVYGAVHGYLGAGVGEVLGQMLLIVWTARVGAQLWRTGRRVLGTVGLATLPMWIAGLSEPLSTALAGLPVFETTPLAFMTWEAWLLALGVSAVRGSTGASLAPGR